MPEDLVGRVVYSTGFRLIYAGKERDLECPNCHDYLVVRLTAYGWYAICRKDRVRWTHIERTDGITAERWHPMNERDMLTGLPNPEELG